MWLVVIHGPFLDGPEETSCFRYVKPQRHARCEWRGLIDYRAETSSVWIFLVRVTPWRVPLRLIGVGMGRLIFQRWSEM